MMAFIEAVLSFYVHGVEDFVCDMLCDMSKLSEYIFFECIQI